MTKAPIKETINDISHLPADTYHLKITYLKMIQSRTGRYGVLLKLTPIRSKDISLFHSIWFGNYKYFKDTNRKKSTAVWRSAKKQAQKAGLKISDLLKGKVIGKTFIAKVGYEEDYLEFGPRNYIEEIIA